MVWFWLYSFSYCDFGKITSKLECQFLFGGSWAMRSIYQASSDVVVGLCFWLAIESWSRDRSDGRWGMMTSGYFMRGRKAPILSKDR